MLPPISLLIPRDFVLNAIFISNRQIFSLFFSFSLTFNSMHLSPSLFFHSNSINLYKVQREEALRHEWVKIYLTLRLIAWIWQMFAQAAWERKKRMPVWVQFARYVGVDRRMKILGEEQANEERKNARDKKERVSMRWRFNFPPLAWYDFFLPLWCNEDTARRSKGRRGKWITRNLTHTKERRKKEKKNPVKRKTETGYCWRHNRDTCVLEECQVKRQFICPQGNDECTWKHEKHERQW